MKRFLTATCALVLGVLPVLNGAPAAASPPRSMPVPPGLTSSDVSFGGYGGLTLHGTVLTPASASAPVPGVVLVAGSGSGTPRERLLIEATAFAEQGIAVLIYDKRSVGYTNLRRSYSELAEDVLGAVGALRSQPGVDPAKVGLWGLSEGGWVVPLAASRSADVAFVIVVGGNAMAPIQQQTWNEASSLRRAGVSGSLIDRAKWNFARLGADAGLFSEAHHDAQAVLERVGQPLLGVWGSNDLQTPPGDNPPLFAQALERGGNTHYTFRFFSGADHAVHQSVDGGLTRSPELAPGYAELVGSWIVGVTSGRLPSADAPTPPRQAAPSVAAPPSAWWESAGVQLGVFVLFVVAFTAYPLVALVRRLRGRSRPPVSRWARLLSAGGLGTALGLFGYLVYLMAAGRSPNPGAVLAGRPLPWLLLQALAVAAVAATLLTAVAWRRAGAAVPSGERVRLGMLLAGGVVFVPWAFYWGLLLP